MLFIAEAAEKGIWPYQILSLCRIFKMDWNRFCYPTVNSFNLP